MASHPTMAQKDPDLLTKKLVSFVDYVSKTVVSKIILEKDNSNG